MNKLDKQYTDLLQDILDNGVTKSDRTGTGTLSVFGRQIRHKMSDGFPLITTKKMAWKSVVTELLWFLRGDTNIKYLVDNGCNIWNGDAYKKYRNTPKEKMEDGDLEFLSASHAYEDYYFEEDFIEMIKTDERFAKKWGDLGPIYGAQWRKWDGIDQIQELITTLKTNPDSRRMLVSAWNVNYLDEMVLPPCHYGFQVYTRELSFDERRSLYESRIENVNSSLGLQDFDEFNIPKRAISLMWNQRSVDTFLGLPFNIASYGLLLEIIAKAVNMVPDELIGNLGDVHLYSNHIEQAKEQIGRELSLDERKSMWSKNNPFKDMSWHNMEEDYCIELLNEDNIPNRTREPYPLPTLNINTEFWQTESGECGVGPLSTNLQGFEIDDFQIENYQSHPTIKAPLSN
jgi:thymidylate synthase